MSVSFDGFTTMFGTVNNLQGLKDKIVDNAVNGRLTERKVNVESATLLIEKANLIEEELIRKGLTKKSKLQNSNFEKTYELPQNWAWTTLGEITNQLSLNDGDWIVSSDMDENGEIKLIQLGSIGYANYIDKGFKYINKSTFERIGCKAILPGYLLINRLIGDRMYACKMPDIEGDIITAVDVCWLSPQEEVYNLDYIMYAVLSSCFQNAVKEQGKGTTRLRISKGNLINIPFPLPPIEEQNEIVERIKMLHNEVDQLEAKLKKKEHLLELLPQAVVGAVSSSETEHQLKEQLEFVIENFESIFQTPESMQDLRNVILQLAIEGKLVQQDPTDEPASELLKKIKAEREQLVREKKIKKPAVLEPISEDEIPFEIPESWEWVRLGEIGDALIGLTYSPSNIVTSGLPVLRSNNIKNGRINHSELVYVNSKPKEELIVKLNDLLICARNGSKHLVGKSALIDEKSAGMTYGAFMTVFRSNFNPYVYQFLNSQAFRCQLGDSNTTTVNQVTQSMLFNIIMPFPPLNEQKRILDKLSVLLTVVGEMEKVLLKKENTIKKLANL